MIDKIKLNPPSSINLEEYHTFENGSLKERVFRLLITNTDLFFMEASIVYAVLADACGSTSEKIKEALFDLELEMTTGTLVQ